MYYYNYYHNHHHPLPPPTAFTVFDSYLPLAVAGLPITNIKNAREARAHLTQALHTYADDNSAIIEKRWDYFNKRVDQGEWTKHEGNGYQLAMLWAR